MLEIPSQQVNMDTLTHNERSLRMSLIRAKDTRPEMLIRKMAFGCGFRYRLHVSGLPGRPDLVFHGLRKIVFVHGCFWHRHPNCKLARLPKSKLDFWVPKLTKNRQRDLTVLRKLRNSGWRVLVLWECETKNRAVVLRKLTQFLRAQ
jgi:DNA mismatch endonuclease, patch repair protein